MKARLIPTTAATSRRRTLSVVPSCEVPLESVDRGPGDDVVDHDDLCRSIGATIPVAAAVTRPRRSGVHPAFGLSAGITSLGRAEGRDEPVADLLPLWIHLELRRPTLLPASRRSRRSDPRRARISAFRPALYRFGLARSGRSLRVLDLVVRQPAGSISDRSMTLLSAVTWILGSRPGRNASLLLRIEASIRAASKSPSAVSARSAAVSSHGRRVTSQPCRARLPRFLSSAEHGCSAGDQHSVQRVSRRRAACGP